MSFSLTDRSSCRRGAGRPTLTLTSITSPPSPGHERRTRDDDLCPHQRTCKLAGDRATDRLGHDVPVFYSPPFLHFKDFSGIFNACAFLSCSAVAYHSKLCKHEYRSIVKAEISARPSVCPSYSNKASAMIFKPTQSPETLVFADIKNIPKIKRGHP